MTIYARVETAEERILTGHFSQQRQEGIAGEKPKYAAPDGAYDLPPFVFFVYRAGAISL